MAEYIKREEYCREHCSRDNEFCGKESCPLWEVPAADVAPVRHGRWICISKGYGEYECSVCHGMDLNCSDYYGTHVVTEQEFCPNCGAKMDLED